MQLHTNFLQCPQQRSIYDHNKVDMPGHNQIFSYLRLKNWLAQITSDLVLKANTSIAKYQHQKKSKHQNLNKIYI